MFCVISNVANLDLCYVSLPLGVKRDWCASSRCSTRYSRLPDSDGLKCVGNIQLDAT